MDYSDIIGAILLALALVAGVWLWIVLASYMAGWL